MRIVLIGYGNIGKEIERVLASKQITVDYIFRNTGVYKDGERIDDKENFDKYVNKDSAVFISIPSVGNGSEALDYYEKALGKGALVITCEKAVLANHWGLVIEHKGRLGYSATVGGGSGILNALGSYKASDIQEIKAVVNGTLNYVCEKISKGLSESDVCQDVLAKGFAEPNAKTFEEVVSGELKDVVYKTAILANHSGLYNKIFTPNDINVSPHKTNTRCAVVITKDTVNAGFLDMKDVSWFPSGINNVLYINGKKIVEGAGAGARVTAERMYQDFEELNK